MTTAVTRTICTNCEKDKMVYLCQRCSEIFPHDHFLQYQKNLIEQMDKIEHQHQTLRNESNEEINHWERESIEKIQQKAEQCRQNLINYSNDYLLQIEKKFDHLVERIQAMYDEIDLKESDLRHLGEMSEKLQEELRQPINLSIKQQSTTFINNIFIRTPSGEKTSEKTNHFSIH